MNSMAHPMVIALGDGVFSHPAQAQTAQAAQTQAVQAQAQAQVQAQAQAQAQQAQAQAQMTDGVDGVSRIPRFLPHERVFPIQIGCQLFKLSGASISSDGEPLSSQDWAGLANPAFSVSLPLAPSYFSQWFKCKLLEAEQQRQDVELKPIPTLYIDRDPETFRDIALHLQGYHVKPRDGTHFVRLFADAQFYQLPKLISQLYDESIFMSIGGREFQIPRELFMTPENSPNYFSLGFAAFFSNKEDLFPGLKREGLLRPPSIQPPCVPSRSADIFEDILRLLRGYSVEIQSPAHREALLDDVRYFNFKGLEQKLIPHKISYNAQRNVTEIAMRLQDIMRSGLDVRQDSAVAHVDPNVSWVTYKRPHADVNVDQPMDLIVEIGTEATQLHINSQNGSRTVHAEFIGISSNKVGKLLQIIAGRIGLPPTRPEYAGMHSSAQVVPAWSTLSGEYVRCVFEPETSIVLDGEPYSFDMENGITGQLGAGTPTEASRKRRRTDVASSMLENWTVLKGLWRIRIQSRGMGEGHSHSHGLECVLVGVKIDAVSCENARNAARGFLE